MKEVSREEWARRLLEDQLARLGELRNANPRDAGFKLWRQTTLTVIQRIWPADLSKSERFRRIPFTPTTPKTTRTQLKEIYERGCAEAVTCLRGLVLELQNSRAPAPPPAPPVGEPEAPRLELPDMPASSDEAPAFERDPFEPSPFDWDRAPASGEPPPRPMGRKFDDDILDESRSVAPEAATRPPAAPAEPKPPRPTAAPTRPQEPQAAKPSETPRDRPAETPKARAPETPKGRAAETPRARPAETPKPRPTAPTPPPVAPAPPPHPPRPTLRDDRRALKEMLGFVDEQGTQEEQAQEPVPPPSAARDPEPTYVPPRPAPSFVASSFEDEPGTDGAEEVTEEAIEAEPDFPPTIAYEEEEETEDLEVDAEYEVEAPVEPAIEFLKRSPVFSAEPKAPKAPAMKAVERTAGAAALTALAGEVAALGVPPGRRAEVRSALMEMARNLDERAASWESLRRLMELALEHPPLARRIVPLLVPYLDLE